MNIHPAAALFPPLSEDRLAELTADIKAHGLRHPIVIYKGQILDGRNRQLACDKIGRKVAYIDVTATVADPIAYVVSANLQRRDLTKEQRAAIVAELATLPRGGDRGNQHTGGKGSNDPLAPTIEQAAKKAGISASSVKRAKKVMREDPAAHQAAKAGQKVKRTRAAKTAQPTPTPAPKPTLQADEVTVTFTLPRAKHQELCKLAERCSGIALSATVPVLVLILREAVDLVLQNHPDITQPLPRRSHRDWMLLYEQLIRHFNAAHHDDLPANLSGANEDACMRVLHLFKEREQHHVAALRKAREHGASGEAKPPKSPNAARRKPEGATNPATDAAAPPEVVLAKPTAKPDDGKQERDGAMIPLQETDGKWEQPPNGKGPPS